MKVRSTAAAAILEAPELLESALADAKENAAGAGEKAVQTSMESIEKRFNVLKNDLRQTAIEAIDSGSIGNVIDSIDEIINHIRETGADVLPVISALTDVLNLALKVINVAPVGGVVGAVLGIKGVFGKENGLNQLGVDKLFKIFKVSRPDVLISKSELDIIEQSVEGITDQATACANLEAQYQSLNPTTATFIQNQIAEGKTSGEVVEACRKQAAATKTLTFAQGALNVALSMGVSILASLAIQAISKFIHSEENARKEMAATLRTLEDATNDMKKYSDAIEDVIHKYSEYNDKLSDVNTTEADVAQIRQELYNLQENINSQFGDTVKGIDLVNGKYKEQIALLDEAISKERKKYLAEHGGEYAEAQSVNRERWMNELIDSSQLSAWGQALPRRVLESLLEDYGFDLLNGTAKEYQDVLNDILSDYASQELSIDDVISKSRLSQTESNTKEITSIMDAIRDAWSEKISSEESYISEAIKAEDLIAEFEEAAVLNNKAYGPVYEQFSEAIDKLEEAQVAGNNALFTQLLQEMYGAISNVEVPDEFKDAFDRLYDRVDEARTKYEADLKKAQEEAAQAQKEFDEARDRILYKKIMGYDGNGNQNANRQFTSNGYMGDAEYGAPTKWNEEEIKAAFDALEVDTWDEIHAFDRAINKATEDGISDVYELFKVYKKELAELNKIQKIGYDEWLGRESGIYSDKDKGERYSNNALIEAYKSSVSQFNEYFSKERKAGEEINWGEVATSIANTELFKQLGIDSIDKYIEGLGANSDTVGQYLSDVFSAILKSFDTEELTGTGLGLLVDDLYDINSEIFGVSQSTLKIEKDYMDLKKLQQEVADGKIYNKDEMDALIDRYEDLASAIEEVQTVIDEESGETQIQYKIQGDAVDTLVNKFAVMSNEAIASMKDQQTYAKDTIIWLRKMELQILQNTLDTYNLGVVAEDVANIYNQRDGWAMHQATAGLSVEELRKFNSPEVQSVISETSARLKELDLMFKDLDFKESAKDTTDKDKSDKDSKATLDWLEQYLEKRNRLVEEKNKELENISKVDILANDADAINKQLEKLQKGGGVNLKLRPEIDTEELNKASWKAGEGFATVFSSTYSNKAGDVAMNFTPIIVDPLTGEYKGVLSPTELQAYAEDVIAGVREDNLNLQIGAKFTGKNAIKQAEEAAIRIHDLHEQLSETSNNVEAKYYEQRKEALDEYNKSLEQQLYAYRVAEKEYSDRMTSGVLFDELAKAAGSEKAARKLVKKIMAGESINLEEMSSELQSAISNMVSNWNNKRDAAEKQIEIGIQLNENAVTAINDEIEAITNKYDRVVKEYEQRQKTLEHYQTLQTTKGYMSNEQYILALIDNESKELAANIKLRDELNTEIQSFIPTTEDELKKWYELKDQIDTTTASIYENQEAIASWQNEVKKLEWDLDKKIMEMSYGITDEADFFINHLDNKDAYNYAREFLGNDAVKTKLYDGLMSAEGLSTLAMRFVKRKAFQEEIKEYSKQIAEAEALYLQDTANTENLEHLNELKDLQRQIIENYDAEKDAIVDLVKEGYDAQLNSLQSLIDKYMEAARAEKDLLDYQQQQAKQAKNIANLRKQIAAYTNDQSEEARAKLQTLQVQLEEAEEERGNTEYERRLSDLQDILDRTYQTVEDTFNDRMEDTDQILKDAKDLVKDNIPTIKTTLSDSLTFSKNNAAAVSETLNSVLDGDIVHVASNVAIVDGDIKAVKDSVNNIPENLKEFYKTYDLEKQKKEDIYGWIKNLDAEVSKFNTNFAELIDKFDIQTTETLDSIETQEKITEEVSEKTSALFSGMKDIIESSFTTSSNKTLTPATQSSLADSSLSDIGAVESYLTKIYDMYHSGSSIEDAIKAVYKMSPNATINTTIQLNNVTDYQSFIDEFKKNKQFENLIQTITFNQLNGSSNSLKKLSV